MKRQRSVKNRDKNGQKRKKKKERRGEEWKLIWRSGSETQAAVSLRVTLGYTAMMSPHAGTVGLRNRLAI